MAYAYLTFLSTNKASTEHQVTSCEKWIGGY